MKSYKTMEFLYNDGEKQVLFEGLYAYLLES